MSYNSGINYEMRKTFLKKFEEWRKLNNITVRDIARRLKLSSSANYSLWINSDKPMISCENLIELHDWSGVAL
jgi:transcriptional regulator with XRE-family HTH domain